MAGDALNLREVPLLGDDGSRSAVETQSLTDGSRLGKPSFLHCYRRASDCSPRDCLLPKEAIPPPLSRMNPPHSRTTTSGPNLAPSSRN